MHDTIKEILGFLSRWTLLAMAAVCAACVAWAAAVGVMAAGGEWPRVVLSDQIRQSGTARFVPGRIEPNVGTDSSLELISWPPGRRGETAYTTQILALVAMEKEAPLGLHPVHITGSPYGQFAFCQDSARCLVIPPGRRVLAVDVRLLEAPGQVEAFIERVAGVAEVVLVRPGPVTSPAAQQALRDAVMKRCPQTLLVYSTSLPGKATDALASIAGSLGRKDHAGVEFVTGDALLADAAAAERYKTYWVAGEEVGGIQPRGAGRYDTMARLAAELAPPEE